VALPAITHHEDARHQTQCEVD